jgi:transposase InsO family protein
MLKHLGVSKSGYYSWLSREPSDQSKLKAEVIDAIMAIYEDSKHIYGAPKITRELHSKGYSTAERTVTRYMQEMGIKACWVRPYTVTTHSEDFSDELKNILDRDFSPEEPNAVWCTDITYIPTNEGFVYLSCIMDLYSRRILAWELAPTLETEYVIKAIRKALQVSGKKPKIIHTDRGVQYTSDLYYAQTKGIQHSYSPKGSPWDNACIESFHALIKREWLNRFKIRDIDQAHRLVFEYIDMFYNTIRIHSHCGYLSPFMYENLFYQAQLFAKQNAA